MNFSSVLSFCITIGIKDLIQHPRYQKVGVGFNDDGLTVLKDPFEVGFEVNNCCF